MLSIVLSARCPSLADLLSQAAAHSQRIGHHKTSHQQSLQSSLVDTSSARMNFNLALQQI